MDLINKFLNLVAPPFTLFSILFFVPPYYFFNLFLSKLRSIFSENVAGKVVLITGASSGIGEHLAYEYGKRGACLALGARRENRLRQVADAARQLGSPDVLIIPADVSLPLDCKRLVDQTINHFGRLTACAVDHLVNNAGITQFGMFEDTDDVTNMRRVMDINFWGYVYTTRFAVPHLRNSRGKVIVLSSAASWMAAPSMSFYNASKAAISQFFETLRVEFGPDIKITLVTPGFIESEMTKGKFLNKDGQVEFNQEVRDVQVGLFPVAKVEDCVQKIVDSACRGERYVTAPAWFRVTYLWKLFFPELVEWISRVLLTTGPGSSPKEALSKKILDVTGAKKILYPETIQIPENKTE